MKTNKTIIKVLTIVMVLTLLNLNIVTAEGIVSKEETVYANLNNKGEELDKTSSIWLHSDGSLNNIEDESILKEVTNVKGEEKPTVENGKRIANTTRNKILFRWQRSKSRRYSWKKW